MDYTGEDLSFKITDRNSYKKIFNLYYKSLVLFASKFIKDPGDVEDLVQDSFVALWENRKNLKTVNSVKAYLYTTLRNKCLNFLRHSKHVNSYIEALKDLENYIDFSKELIKEETFRLFYQAVNDLSENARKVIMLTLEGYKRDEIAEKLGISTDTVKYHKKSAIFKLKQKLGENFYMLILIV